MTAPAGAGRRRFLSFLAVLFSSAIAALATLPILGPFFSPLRKPTPTESPDEWVPVAQLHDLEVDIPKRVEVVRKAVDAWSAQEKSVLGAAWLIRRSTDKVEALSTVCPHLGCGVNFERGAFKCPCHTSGFRQDGSVMTGPSPRAMDSLPVEIRNERVYLRYVRFKQGTPHREPI